MKFLFPTILLVSLLGVTADVTAQTQSTPAKSQTTKEQKGAAVAAPVTKPKEIAVKSVQDIIKETTDRNDKAKFGIAAMVKAFREQAANDSNPQKNLFVKDLSIGEQLLQLPTNDLKRATALAEKLTPETQRLLKEALEKRYSVFARLGALKEFVNTRELATA
jgi:hypothetical protein